eukprot:gnl/MRDRNA2_/MRDRNA2_112215_c0_seq1.p1 gnl/MRDRNA2_/MRDRNA2_112215_c0~~gnl/MRDRNA2_/MRDRNA2_112215_c0_seq1.p1  ORF type:complete len:227 (-),score=59.12 gnl/MRDRNA2_/MRDRNA2_112215_c0_seq1:21-701(-)
MRACVVALLLFSPQLRAIPDLEGHLAQMVRDANDAAGFPGFIAKAPKAGAAKRSKAQAAKYVPDYVAMATRRYGTPKDAFSKMEEKAYSDGKLSPSDWNKNCEALKSKEFTAFDCWTAFLVIDKDEDGYVTAEEFYTSVGKDGRSDEWVGPPLTPVQKEAAKQAVTREVREEHLIGGGDVDEDFVDDKQPSIEEIRALYRQKKAYSAANPVSFGACLMLLILATLL